VVHSAAPAEGAAGDTVGRRSTGDTASEARPPLLLAVIERKMKRSSSSPSSPSSTPDLGTALNRASRALSSPMQLPPHRHGESRGLAQRGRLAAAAKLQGRSAAARRGRAGRRP
jgi:hypothetical protein